MHPQFSQLTPQWFKRAFVYTGSIGDFRYRFANDKQAGQIHASIYTVFCFEAARDVQSRDFTWDEPGVEALKQWLQQAYDAFSATGKLPEPVKEDA